MTAIDIDEVRRALHERYEPYNLEDWFAVSIYTRPRPAAPDNYHFRVSNVEGAVELIAGLPPYNTYATMAVFAKEPAPGSNGRAREVSRCAWLWADLDCHDPRHKKEEALSKLLSFRLRPTIIYDSGRGYHAYWRIHPVCTDMPSIEERNRWLASELESDQYKADSVANVNRIMRIPGTVNCNDKD